MGPGENGDAVWGGRYRVERVLGQGERKQVYLATDLLMERSVALALMEPEVAEADHLTVTQWETYVMGQLGDHPHVVTIYDVGEADGQAYIVSQYMRGGDLRGLIKRASGNGQRIPLALVARLTAETCDALGFAHGKGIIHRDVQPGNIWLDVPDGQAHLGDFDLAISTTDSKAPPPSGAIVTTRAYMPPEEARDEPFDGQSDLYSLGATLYELITNRAPFEGSEQEVIEQHLTQEPAPPSRIRPDTPEPLERLTLRLLEKQRSDRPADAASVMDALASIRRGLREDELDVSELIKAGESASLEFKSSLRYDLERGEKNPALERSVAKTAAGFMNAEGGTLLIGVDDRGAVIGIENDLRTLKKSPDLDGWERAFTEAMIKYLGHDAAASTSLLYSHDDRGTVAAIRCPPRSKPTWLKEGDAEEEFFTRIGNATRLLPRQFADVYIDDNWPR
jgi:serine/threonine protein kinase